MNPSLSVKKPIYNNYPETEIGESDNLDLSKGDFTHLDYAPSYIFFGVLALYLANLAYHFPQRYELSRNEIVLIDHGQADHTIYSTIQNIMNRVLPLETNFVRSISTSESNADLVIKEDISDESTDILIETVFVLWALSYVKFALYPNLYGLISRIASQRELSKDVDAWLNVPDVSTYTEPRQGTEDGTTFYPLWTHWKDRGCFDL